jgi:NAD-dependent deacetylase
MTTQDKARADIDRLREFLDKASRAVVFTGAGVSTESGIPDFRSPGGIWETHRPIYFQEFISSEDTRRRYWRQGIAIRKEIWNSMGGLPEPNRGHRAVAELVRRGTVSSVITQNIDGLHQASGVPDEQVIELHGTVAHASCLSCGSRYEIAPILEAFERDETLPICDSCGGVVKTSTIDFGQAMPEVAMSRAERETLACDLFIVLGSSLVVYPAAGFPALAKRRGAKLVIINRDPTDLDHAADLVLHAELGAALGEAVGVE